MPPIKKILVPIDLSPSCAWAARYASQLAALFDARLLFLHVCGDHPLDDANAFLAQTLGPSQHRVVLLEGDPADCIVRVARENAVSLIVMPTHAHGRFRRFLLGSVTAKVLHDTDCPVLTGVHHDDKPFLDLPTFTSIVCAVDCDASSVNVISGAQELAAALGARLSVVHAVPAADETSGNRGEIEVRKCLFEAAAKGFTEICGSASLSVDVSLAGGPVPRVVREEALRRSADLVIVGRGETRGGLGRLRTNTYAIIRNSPCPVLSI
jgi:nucleotide-binding universal stress UspA family protein